jgi:hypothetical protein
MIERDREAVPETHFVQVRRRSLISLASWQEEWVSGCPPPSREGWAQTGGTTGPFSWGGEEGESWWRCGSFLRASVAWAAGVKKSVRSESVTGEGVSVRRRRRRRRRGLSEWHCERWSDWIARTDSKSAQLRYLLNA